MMTSGKTKRALYLILIILSPAMASAQGGGIKWATDGTSYFRIESNEVNRYSLPANTKATFISQADLTPQGQTKGLSVRAFYLSADQQKALIYTNTKRVWRLDSRGDYYVLDLKTKALKKLGAGRPQSSLMFAKFSPDGTRVAFVSEQNLYVENLASGEIKALTKDGNRKLINGTFDWVYEEELSCRDGFQWSPDSKQLSFWQIDATKIRDYYMLNSSDSVYSKIIPVEYPTVGQSPSPARIAVVDVDGAKTTWLKIAGDAQQNYLPRMEWRSATEILVQQLNRKQNESTIYSCNPATGDAKAIFNEKEEAWIDLYSFTGSESALDYHHAFSWLNNKKEFLWANDKDGWSHLYRITADGSKEVLITKGNYDMIDFLTVVEKSNYAYFLASPNNATQKYLYKTKLDGKGKLELVTPAGLEGSHGYDISPNGLYAYHTFSNNYTRNVNELIDLTTHKPLNDRESIQSKLTAAQGPKKVEFFKVKTEEGIEMDGWMIKPKNFDPAKKYPVVFQVYTEPASQTVVDRFGIGNNRLFKGDMAEQGYIYMSVDSRGTPAPKGKTWRKSIYRKVGLLNINDQAMAAKEILKWSFVDPERVAVWGWSGGGTTTLHLLFQYPDIYKTGIAVAAEASRLTYDNIYEERYMGLDMNDYIKCSPITYAKNLKGNLLYIHGTGDDNVHYNNAEMLINELVKHNKQFQFMAYPNRSHGISEGEGTTEHMATLYTEYLKKFCPPGAK
ncbi:MAG: prolyl oligopeptidase family serine peptidase [Cyclobacteriaceae bacterium]|nr:prolyl oligopeptidase family serine peptidase [Cyclobacteriaceae bacterium]